MNKAAAHLGISVPALRQKVARRQVHFGKLGKLLRFRLADLDQQMIEAAETLVQVPREHAASKGNNHEGINDKEENNHEKIGDRR